MGRCSREGVGQIETVLLVDDDLLFLRATSRRLRDAGKHVFATDDANEARALSRSGQPQLALVDMLLGPLGGTVSGITLVEQLRSDREDVFIVLQSCAASANAWTDAYEAGADLALEKGVYQIDELIDRVERGTPLSRPTHESMATPMRIKWEYLQHTLATFRSVRGAAKALGMQRSALQRQLKNRPPR